MNSPEELAKRAAVEVDEPPRNSSTTFRHHNSPEEVARRAAAGASESAPAVIVASPQTADTSRPPARDLELRLRRVELLLFTLVETEAEAREFRMQLNNQQAVTDAQQVAHNRLRALEQSFDRLRDAVGAQLREIEKLERELGQEAATPLPEVIVPGPPSAPNTTEQPEDT